MKQVLAIVVGCFSLLGVCGATTAHLEPAGFGPYEEGRLALRYSRIADLLRLEDEVQGFRFMLLCVFDDSRAVVKIVHEDTNGIWRVAVRETLVSVDRAERRDVRERQVIIEPEAGKEMFTEVVSALREVAYADASLEKDHGPFITGGVEIFVAARPDRVFLAGRTWNPPMGSKAYRIQEIALRLGAE